ncbi:EbsA family protein [Zhouia sp. PK063]|uniref:EbsA family protein n=1 Tax=Zhouia sp. PK063 TaxID=3373602 RepID=UPI0037AE4866
MINKIFSKNIIKFKDIKSANISEVIKLNGVLVDRTQIQLINNKWVNLYAFKYKNFHYLKIVLNYLNKISNVEHLKIKELNLNINKSTMLYTEYTSGKVYNFSHILSTTGFILYSFIFCISVGLIKNENIPMSTVINAIVLLCFVLVMFSRHTHYFVITKNYLIIKNSIRFWKKECFELSEIASINIRYYHRQLGKTIVIKTKNFESISFISDNLFQKDWTAFKSELKLNKIVVHDNSATTTQKIWD